ncbi:MAG: NAD(P)H-hydrate epimerase [Phycisphaerales bacterium]|nr:NAD(P)H-hydrate epimerase [Phycisphaerales bacterium]
MAIPFESGDPLTTGQIRELDVLAIEHVGIPGLLLMENAGRNVAEFVYALLPDPRTAQVVILAGAGNNGGDGTVAARHLDNAGVATCTILAAAPERLRGDAAVNYRILHRLAAGEERSGGAPRLLSAAELPEAAHDPAWQLIRATIDTADVIVDALLGTGARGAPTGVTAALISLGNSARGAWRVAVDIPSGLSADDGVVHDPCFRADATLTLAATKTGFTTAAAHGVLGRVVTLDVGIPRRLVPGTAGAATPPSRAPVRPIGFPA